MLSASNTSLVIVILVGVFLALAFSIWVGYLYNNAINKAVMGRDCFLARHSKLLSFIASAFMLFFIFLNNIDSSIIVALRWLFIIYMLVLISLIFYSAYKSRR